MYTQLLGAALTQERRAGTAVDAGTALDQVRRCRNELSADLPPGMEQHAVPVVLARQLGYDAALLRLAELEGIETDLNRFDLPGAERSRLEGALRGLGIALDDPATPSGRTSPVA